MPIFVKLRYVGGGITYVNMDTVQQLNPDEGGTELVFNDRSAITVKETPQQVQNKLGNTKQEDNDE